MTGYAGGKYELGVMIANCCYMDKMRDDLAADALKNNPDYLLWLDADQVYPQETPEILMKHIDDGHMVVGGMTPDKSDGSPLIYGIDDADKGLIRKRDDVEPGQGLVKVDAMGFGGVMTHPDVFKKLKSPYFEMGWSDKTKDVIGEDVRFYLNCNHFGIDVWCDTNLVYEHLRNMPIKLKSLAKFKTEETNERPKNKDE